MPPHCNSASIPGKGGPYRIGEITALTGLSADTLRYYEKIGLLRDVPRSSSGLRSYGSRHLSTLKFIQRAKAMNFSLDEIARLLEMRSDPQHAREAVRALTHEKLADIEAQIEQLDLLRRELQLLVNLCQASEEGCPIIDDLEQGKPADET